MKNNICVCAYKQLVVVPVTIFSTTLGLLVTGIIIAVGVIVNRRFRIKLQEEKRNTPYFRRGNIVEPIMSWYCLLQMVFWPYLLLFFWAVENGVISSDLISHTWICISLFYLILFGRFYIAWNSFFVALIRYLFTVHEKRANQWDMKQISKRFQLASVIVPVIFVVLYRLFGNATDEVATTSSDQFVIANDQFKQCIAFEGGLNDTDTSESIISDELTVTLKFLPAQWISIIHMVYLVVGLPIALNIPEAYLYIRIFRNIDRYFTTILP